MTFSLRPDLAEFVTQCVASGKYATADDVVEAGLRKLQARQHYQEWLEQELRSGIDDLRNGGCVEFKCKEDFRRFFDEAIVLLRSRFATPTSPDYEFQPADQRAINALGFRDYFDIEIDTQRRIIADLLQQK